MKTRSTKIRIVKDRYSRARGGRSKLIRILCKRCKAEVLTYQKDGPGWLKRCYLNRIVWPQKLARLQRNRRVREPGDMDALRCESCKAVIGIPTRHKDARLAYAIVPGSFIRRDATSSKD